MFINVGSNSTININEVVHFCLEKGKAYIKVTFKGEIDARIDLSSAEEAKTEYSRISAHLVNLK